MGRKGVLLGERKINLQGEWKKFRFMTEWKLPWKMAEIVRLMSAVLYNDNSHGQFSSIAALCCDLLALHHDAVWLSAHVCLASRGASVLARPSSAYSNQTAHFHFWTFLIWAKFSSLISKKYIWCCCRKDRFFYALALTCINRLEECQTIHCHNSILFRSVYMKKKRRSVRDY